MVPSSTKLPSGARSTRDSSTADLARDGLVAALTPSGPSTARQAWLGAVVRAWRFVVGPGHRPAAAAELEREDELAQARTRSGRAPSSPAASARKASLASSRP